MTEQDIEQKLLEKLGDLKYSYRPDIRDRSTLERNFRQKFEELNRVHLTEGEFPRLLEQIVSPSGDSALIVPEESQVRGTEGS